MYLQLGIEHITDMRSRLVKGVKRVVMVVMVVMAIRNALDLIGNKTQIFRKKTTFFSR